MREPQPVNVPTIYCRKCWYILDGLDRHRCPECGRTFDPADRRTYRTMSRRRWRLVMMRRVAVVLLALIAIATAWLYHRYAMERQVMVYLDTRPVPVGYRTTPLGPAWLTGWAAQHDVPMLEAVVSVPAVFMSDFASSDLQHPVATGARPTLWNDDLERLRPLGSLQELEIINEEVTDAGLAHLQRLTSLRKLYLVHTGITDAGMAHLSGLTDLRSLYVYGGKVTDAGLVHLRNCTKLQHLYLDNLQLTDAGLTHVPGLADLQVLSVTGASVTDAGLEDLHGLTKLRTLYLWGTKVTQKGVAELERALPSLEVRGP